MIFGNSGYIGRCALKISC